jgi:hypothetical protein
VQRSAIHRLGVVAAHLAEPPTVCRGLGADVGVDLHDQQLEGSGGFPGGVVVLGDRHRAPLVTSTEIREAKTAPRAELQAREEMLDDVALKRVNTLPLGLVRAGDLHRADHGCS